MQLREWLYKLKKRVEVLKVDRILISKSGDV